MTTATKTTIVMGLAVMLIGASLAIGESDGQSGGRGGRRQGRGMRGHRPSPKGPYAMLHAPKIGELLRRLDLTDDQRKQARQIRLEARQGLKDIEDKDERRKAHRAAMEAADKKIYDEVLTTEQKAKIDAIRAKKKDIALTDVQEKKIKEIMKAAHDKIYKEVLTDKQRAAVDKAKERCQERREEWREKRKEGGQDGEGRRGRRGGRGKGGEHPGSKGGQTDSE